VSELARRGGAVADAQWGWMVMEASGLLIPGIDPWVEYGISRVSGSLSVHAPAGPAVYAVRGGSHWQYVGKTTRSVGARLREHGRTDPSLSKSLHWSTVLVLHLKEDVSAQQISKLETLGRDYLRPRGGGAWG
jgi:hypothetical protein